MKAINAKTHEVQAILQGRRTQARIIIKTQPDSRGFRTTDTLFEDYHGRKVNPPYQPGDILYVREAWTWAEDTSYDEHVSNGGWKYKADHHDGDDKWKPSTQMPKEAARIFLRVKSVWAERVLNLDRLRKDVKEWVDDLDRKYPEWMLEGSPQVAENWLSFRTPINGHQFPSVYLAPDYPYFASSIIGINPDDYFEEVISD